MKEKILKITNKKYFSLLIAIIMNSVLIIIFNCFCEMNYETIDDFTISNILSKTDGTYNFYTIHIHPILSYFIMVLYKTKINMNFYSLFLLIMQFVSFTTIGRIIISNNKKIGIPLYLLIISTMYTRMLENVQYTSVATLAILSGMIWLIEFNEKEKTYKSKIWALFLIFIGIMLRYKAIVIVLPFYICYAIIDIYKKRRKNTILDFIVIILALVILHITNYILYNYNSTYKKYSEFNTIRTYFFDFNIFDYNSNKEILNEIGWTKNDYDMLYSYSQCDENNYNIDALLELKNKIGVPNDEQYINKIINTLKLTVIYIEKVYWRLTLINFILLLISYVSKRNRLNTTICFILNLMLLYILIYTHPVYRVILSAYMSSMIMMCYYICIGKKEKTNYINIIIALIIFITIFNFYTTIKSASIYKKENYLYLREIIDYTKQNKENAYIYSTSLNSTYLSYSLLEKIEDDSFINLRSMSDWDIYNKEYYDFKERYQLNNIIEDLYKKDNVYLITGNTRTAHNTVISNHIELIQRYIKQHYNIDVQYRIEKEFKNNIKIYKLYEEGN